MATATLVYSAITFVCMDFGVDEWIERGEAFSGYFGMFSRLSVFEAREGRLGRRRFLTGAPSWAAVPGSAALVLASIGVTSFDGAQEGALKSAISSTFNHIHDIGFGTIATFRITNSLWLAIVLAGVGLLYWLGIRGMHTVSGSPRARELARSFAHPDPDRAGLHRRPLLQRLHLPGAGPVHLHPLRPPRERLGSVRHRRGGSTMG